jgi:hypothetical protein
LELLLPGGARLHLHDASQAELAAHLLRHLNSTASPAGNGVRRHEARKIKGSSGIPW